MDEQVEKPTPPEAEKPLLEEHAGNGDEASEDAATIPETDAGAEISPESEIPPATWSPYFAGLGLGITLLVSLWFLGTGLGASGGIARFAAWAWHGIVPGHVERSAYFGEWFRPGSHHVLQHYLIFMVAGIFVGALLSALGSDRIRPMVERGPRISPKTRLWFALGGGFLVGFASRLARGCTSGQALTGSAMFFTGSAVFLVCMFIGGYAVALFARREWL